MEIQWHLDLSASYDYGHRQNPPSESANMEFHFWFLGSSILTRTNNLICWFIRSQPSACSSTLFSCFHLPGIIGFRLNSKLHCKLLGAKNWWKSYASWVAFDCENVLHEHGWQFSKLQHHFLLFLRHLETYISNLGWICTTLSPSYDFHFIGRLSPEVFL